MTTARGEGGEDMATVYVKRFQINHTPHIRPIRPHEVLPHQHTCVCQALSANSPTTHTSTPDTYRRFSL
jgi:hypothetical protein